MKDENISSNVDEKVKKLKIESKANASLLSFPSDKNVDTLFYVDDSILKFKTVINSDEKLEIFIEKAGKTI